MTSTLEYSSALATFLLLNGLVGTAGAASADPSASAATSNQRAIVEKAAAPPPAFREIKWEGLMPKGWDPSKQFLGRNTTIRNDMDPLRVH